MLSDAVKLKRCGRSSRTQQSDALPTLRSPEEGTKREPVGRCSHQSFGRWRLLAVSVLVWGYKANLHRAVLRSPGCGTSTGTLVLLLVGS